MGVYMKRYCLALDLKDDPQLIAEYEAYHQNVWPEILQSISGAGISNMEIYRISNRLFMIMDSDPAAAAGARSTDDSDNPHVRAWEALMGELQQELPFPTRGAGAGKWQLLEHIYSLTEQP